jgi:DNA polymerase-1
VAPYLLLDGYSLAFRAWFALQDADLVTASGQQTQAVYGFAGMFGRLLEDHSPAGMAVAFDRSEPTFRDGLKSDYKAGRSETPEPLREQFGLIRQMVESLGVPLLEVVGFEADDVIATVASRLEAAGEDVIIVTGDRDTYQLVHDPHVKVLYNRRGVTDYVLYDEAGIVERTGVVPALYPMLAALRGDPSDNLPGVPGVGEKTAAKLVNAYQSIDSLYEHLDEQTPKLRASLAEFEDQVRLNARLTPLVRDVPVEVSLEAMRFGGSDRHALNSLFTLLEIRVPKERILKSLDRLEGVGAGVGGDAGAPQASEGMHVEDVVLLGDVPSALEFLTELDACDTGIGVEVEWTGAPGRSAVIGVALCRMPEKPGGLAVGWLPGELVAEEVLRPVLSSIFGCRAGETVGRIVTHRAKETMRGLEPSGIMFDGLDLDTAVAGYLADPREGQATLERLAEQVGLAPAPVGAAGTAGSGREPAGEQLGFALEDASRLGAAAAEAADRLALVVSVAGALRSALVSAGAERLYSEIERPLVRVLADMELVGIGVDASKLEAINKELTDETASLEAEVCRLAGEDFNINSTPQLRHVLFDKLGLVPQKRTKTGYSTDAQTLERMKGVHPIVDALLRYREVEKLRSTYGSGLLSEVAPDGRIHASFNQTVARTGRLSSDQPNLHNIPSRSELGRRFREAFVPAEGNALLVADYDQIELRVIAHLAQDPGLVEAFRTGQDIHSATAARVFGVDPADVTPAQRAKAKMVSYGLAYGMEAYGLSQRLAIPVEEAAAILQQYFTAFPNVKEYMARTVGDARARGYTETLFGRRRYLPELDSPNYRVRQAAERQAMNAGIQGLAADIFKVALVRLSDALRAGGLASRIVLQVHDEILVEAPFEEADPVADLVDETMVGACQLSVPLAVHVARGRSWADAKGRGAGGSGGPAAAAGSGAPGDDVADLSDEEALALVSDDLDG